MPLLGDYEVQPAIPGLGEPYESPEDRSIREPSLEDQALDLDPEQVLWELDEVHTEEVAIETKGGSVKGTKLEAREQVLAEAAYRSCILLNINVAAA
jgi:hypothetical protein